MNWPAEIVPFPVKVTVCGLPVALSVIVTAAVSTIVKVGVKVTLIVQVPPGARVPHVSVSAKSLAFVPVTAMLAILKSGSRSVLRVTSGAVLVSPTYRLPKAKLVAERLMTGPEPVITKFTGLDVPPLGPGFVTTTA
jgi:hypothetical protein